MWLYSTTCYALVLLVCITRTCERHCSTATPEVHSTKHRFFTVQAAVTPTSVFPAPTCTVVHVQVGKLVSLYTARTTQSRALKTRSLDQHTLLKHDALTARQHDDSRARTTVAEHFTQTFLLIRTEYCAGSEVDVDVLVARVVLEVVLRQQRVVQLDTPNYKQTQPF